MPLQVFLISTLAGSVGINLVAAHRMVLYDMPWNPVHNKQVGTAGDIGEQSSMDYIHRRSRLMNHE